VRDALPYFYGLIVKYNTLPAIVKRRLREGEGAGRVREGGKDVGRVRWEGGCGEGVRGADVRQNSVGIP
jgi:hypothetical protein